MAIKRTSTRRVFTKESSIRDRELAMERLQRTVLDDSIPSATPRRRRTRLWMKWQGVTVALSELRRGERTWWPGGWSRTAKSSATPKP